jgi:hypothetical protein
VVFLGNLLHGINNFLTEIADMAVTESLSNIMMDADINQSAIRAPRIVKEFKGKNFCLKGLL